MLGSGILRRDYNTVARRRIHEDGIEGGQPRGSRPLVHVFVQRCALAVFSIGSRPGNMSSTTSRGAARCSRRWVQRIYSTTATAMKPTPDDYESGIQAASTSRRNRGSIPADGDVRVRAHIDVRFENSHASVDTRADESERRNVARLLSLRSGLNEEEDRRQLGGDIHMHFQDVPDMPLNVDTTTAPCRARLTPRRDPAPESSRRVVIWRAHRGRRPLQSSRSDPINLLSVQISRTERPPAGEPSRLGIRFGHELRRGSRLPCSGSRPIRVRHSGGDARLARARGRRNLRKAIG